MHVGYQRNNHSVEESSGPPLLTQLSHTWSLNVHPLMTSHVSPIKECQSWSETTLVTSNNKPDCLVLGKDL